MKRDVSLLFIIIMTLVGCSVTLPPKNHYLISIIEKNNYKTLPYSVRVGNIYKPNYLSDSRIIYMIDSLTIDYYNYQLWAMPIDQMVEYFLYKYLKTNKVFSSVVAPNISKVPNYTVMGVLNYIGEFDIGEDRYAKIDIIFSLNNDRGDELFSKNYIKKEKLKIEKNEDLFLKELIYTLNKLLNSAVKDYLSYCYNMLSKDLK